jgi:hypothetical protein
MRRARRSQEISYSVKDGKGCIHSEATIPGTRIDLDMEEDSSATVEARLFRGWIYDYLKPHAAGLA